MQRTRFVLVAWLVAMAVLSAGGAGAGRARAQQPPAAAAPVPAPVRTHGFVSPFSYEWFVRAELLLARGQYAAAAEAYRMALSSADDDAYVFARLAEALDRGGDAAGAAEALQTGLQIDPQSEAIWLEHGAIAQRSGHVEDAIAAFERAESAAPKSPDAPLALAQLLRAQNAPERATAVLERFAARTDAGSLSALRARLELARMRGDVAALVATAREWLRRAPIDVELLAQLAIELLAARQAALAARVIAVAPPGSVEPRVQLEVALALARSDQVELLLAVTPVDRLGGVLEVAEAYLRIGQATRALGVLDERASAEEAEPSRRAWLTGLAQLENGDPVAAARELARIPSASSYAPRARLALGQALQAAGLPALGREVSAAK